MAIVGCRIETSGGLLGSAQDINSLAHLAQFFTQNFIVGWGRVYEIIDFRQLYLLKLFPDGWLTMAQDINYSHILHHS
ncbi:hypothetical protein D0A37_27865 [Microcoleus vaginatus HSN003]|nr:hypothetical protein D0A37_27865 [Microcoleus vaginatus HSN003]